MTPRYYISRVGSEKTFNDLNAVREAAEHLANSNPGDEVLILKVVGTSIAPPRHATTTWLDGAPSQAPELTISSAMRDLTGTVGKALGVEVTPWSWPILPPGHSYLNPEKLTVEQLGHGWRPLCTLDEWFPSDHQVYYRDRWVTPPIHSPCRTSFESPITARTRAPIPTQQ